MSVQKTQPMFTTTTAPSPQLSDEVPGSLQSSPLLSKTFGQPQWAGAVCPGAQRAATGSTASGNSSEAGGIRRSAAVPSGEPAGAHGPSPRSHPPQSPGWGSPPYPHPPLTSRFPGRHSPVPVRLPETAQAPAPASPILAPGRCPQRPPSSSSPWSGFSSPRRSPGLSPPSSHRCSLFICRWLTAVRPRPLPSRRRHTRPPGRERAPRARRPALLGGRTRLGSPRTGRIPPPCRSPLPAAKPVPPAIPLPSFPQH